MPFTRNAILEIKSKCTISLNSSHIGCTSKEGHVRASDYMRAIYLWRNNLTHIETSFANGASKR